MVASGQCGVNRICQLTGISKATYYAVFMAKKAVLKPAVAELVSAYGQDLKARGIGWQKLIVFGSHAKGNQSNVE